MAEELASAFTLTDEGVSSPSGEWTLRYREDGVAAIVDGSGAQTWVAGGDAPVAGKLRLENDTRLTVYDDAGVRWDSGPLLPDPGSGPADGYGHLRVTDTGDGILVNQWGLPRWSLRHGLIEPVSLGDHAPVAEISGLRYLRSAQGERLVVRQPDGSLKYSSALGLGARWTQTVSASEALTLEQEGTELTWRFLGRAGRRQWVLVLLAGERVRWNLGGAIESDPVEDEPVEDEPPAGPLPLDAPYDGAWVGETGLDVEWACCITAIAGVEPDEALRRLGATDDQIVTATWPEHVDRASFEDGRSNAVAAFSIGGHSVLVEENGFRAVYWSHLSRDTTAVTAYRNINGVAKFVVSRDGRAQVGLADGDLGQAPDGDASVVLAALAEMGISDLDEFSRSDEPLDEIELLCRVAGIRPTRATVAAPVRGAVLVVPTPVEMREMMHPTR